MRPGSLIRAGAAALWLLGAGLGLNRLWVYDTLPGAAARERPDWPAAATLARATDRCTLLLFAHPRCPCTGASLDELGAIVAEAGGRTAVHVMFFAPEDSPAGWERTRLWDRAAALPGAVVRRDEGGRLARLFGARTSGQVLVYGADGRLAYSGGITAARGHAGDNAGRDAVVALLSGSCRRRDGAPVYGCPLSDPGLEDAEESQGE